ncbi:hypothetical protein AWB74_08614 [Caballeronia arvi]|uniref:DUF2934 domain-containing protein n=1 Tax=Caballeronia arvi TaxID=1777135 RepID=A0A158L5J1_9BURK|nr:DUF2934 domain-containing protein [Caballeronia arvi]SAL88542.1 hypothetical protein AWB74_08614 [Caballeronia arvi]
MKVPITEEQIRALAYRLWEEAGCPEGGDEQFWHQARKQLETSSDASQTADETDDKGTTDLPRTSSDERT